VRTQQLLGKVVIQEVEIKVLKEILFDKLGLTNEEYSKYFDKVCGETNEEKHEYTVKILKEISALPTID